MTRQVILNHRTQQFRLVDEAGHTAGRFDEVSLAFDGRGGRVHRGVCYDRVGSPIVMATVAAHQ